MSCDVMVAIEINHLPKRIVENINPCKSLKTVVKTAPPPFPVPSFMRNFRGKKKVFLFFSFTERGMEKAAFVL